MSIADRRAVPLKSRCSRKCVEPWWPVASSREPTPTQQPKVTERRPGIASVSTRTPPGRTERRTTAPSASPATVWSRDPAGTSGRGTAGTSGVRRRGLLLGALAVPGLAGRLPLGRRPGALAVRQDRDERELAARVDLGDLDLHLLADREHVLDVLDPLAADHLADLRDVQQSVLARDERDEGAERRRLDDGAHVALADLRHGRVGDRVDRRAR